MSTTFKLGMMFMDKKVVVGAIAIVGCAFLFGVLIGHLVTSSGGDDDAGGGSGGAGTNPMLDKLIEDRFKNEQDLIDKLMDDIDSVQIRSYLQYLSERPHIAAQERDVELTNWIRDTWQESGLEDVELAEYDFYLSWPNQTDPNKIFLLDGSGQKVFTSHHKEEELRAGDDAPDFVHAFNAFGADGVADGQLVYVNYGRVEDLIELEDDLGVSVSGRICIARYGKIFRGNKVKNCEERGAIGVILFSDPGDVAHEGTEPENVYPNTIFLPGTGVQRGSTFIGNGDPLSPGWPSVKNAYRMSPDDTKLPKIPVQPIGYDDAKILLEKMGGRDSPDTWKGKIAGITYKLGGEMLPEFKDFSVQVHVHNYRDTAKSSNVIGYIKGDAEPDRYVLLSNHRDAWGYGAVDPSSGTAQLMEVARVLGKISRDGWKPKRTLVFASWAAEESGLMGSYEWVSEKIQKVMQRTVGLVNTDICVSGPIAKPQATPVLKDVVLDALRQASDPTKDKGSYYDFWKKWHEVESDDDLAKKVTLLGSGSDHAPFAFFAGVPAVNLRFKDDSKKYKGIGQYPTYHTGYETFYLQDKLIDPGFKLHRTCAQTSAHMLLNLADSLMLPYDLRHLSLSMKDALDTFRENNVTRQLEDNDATLRHLDEAVADFHIATGRYMERLKQLDRKDPMQVRMVNDQMMQLERVFVVPTGLPGRPDVRHAVFAPAKFNSYGSASFPGVSDLLHEIEKLKGDEQVERWEEIKRHVSDLMIMVQQATSFLRPLHQF